MPVRILLADDHLMFRQGLRRLLEADPELEVVGEASDGEEACKLAAELKPDVILMDIHMPHMDGVQATRQIIQQDPEAKIIILSMSRQKEYVVDAIKNGARGYFLKESSVFDLIQAIQTVVRGETILEPTLAQRVLQEFRQNTTRHRRRAELLNVLNDREIQILRGVAHGWTNQEIARRLGVSEKTIKNQLSIIFRKLRLENRTQAAIYALQKGLVPLEEVSLDD